MTTIAYRDGILAADSRGMASGWIRPNPARKLRRVESVYGDWIVGICGEYARLEPFIKWLAAGPDRGTMPDMDSSTAIVLGRDGGLTVYEDGGHFSLDPAGYHAWGTGWPPAVAALHMGATAERAVEIAALVDNCTGLPVVTMSLAG